MVTYKMKRGKEIFFLVLLCIITVVAGILSTWYTWNNQPETEPLPDMFLDILPDLSHIETPVVNYIVLVQLTLAIISLPTKNRWQRVGQYILIQSVINTFRSITVASTSLTNIHVYP